MITDNLKRVVFDFGDASDGEDESQSANINDERISSQHSSNIKLIDVADFKRIEVKRNSRKNRTEIPTKKLFTIEKLTEEITKITEELELDSPVSRETILEVVNELDNEKEDPRRKSARQRTIKFHNKKTRFQYPKEMDNKVETEPDSDSKPSEIEEDSKENKEQDYI